MNLEIISKTVNITFAIAVMISAIGWLGFKKGKKAYFTLWISIIPLVICNTFLFFDKNEYYNIIAISIITIVSLSYIIFLICCYPKFLKIKEGSNKQQQEINDTMQLINKLP
ncbi:hypothetical protein [Spiroplasma endosymbiont of Virgichneumon dumeticola]|uniref:hypothetical protein n=1 Tax=Spiroplasma endosymbiont of Virgichneumon dumeticola TaxID=3139323 RepID=UPI0035C8C223